MAIRAEEQIAPTSRMPVAVRRLWGGWHPEERRWLAELRNAIRERYREAVEEVTLFGSKARGDWHAESDIDVLIVIRDAAAARRREIRRLGARLAAGTNVVPGVVVQTRSEWDRIGAARLDWHAEVGRQGVRIL